MSVKSKLAAIYRDMLSISEALPDIRPGYHTFTLNWAESTAFWTHPALAKDRDTLFSEWQAEAFNRYSLRLNGVRFVLEFDASATLAAGVKKGGVQ